MSDYESYQCPCGRNHPAGVECAIGKRSRSLAQAPGSVPFECEACGLTGEVENPKHMESVSCPECNARYLYWPEGKLHGEKSAWKCVVRPYFVAPPNVPAQRPPAKDV